MYRRAIFKSIFAGLAASRKPKAMSGFSNPLVGGNGKLVYPAIKSPNYLADTSGWTINKDGSAEFNNVTIRGALVEDAEGLFYKPSPGLGNLALSLSAKPGTDQYGNTFLGAGPVIYFNDGTDFYALGFTGFSSGSTGLGGLTLAHATSAGGSYSPAVGSFLLRSVAAAAFQAILSTANVIIPQTSAMLEVQGSAAFDLVDAIVGGAAETWHHLSLNGNYSAVAGLVTPSYRLNALGNLEMCGRVQAAAAGSTIGTLPAGYYSATNQHTVPASIPTSGGITAGSTPRLSISTGGVLTISGVTIAAGTQVDLEAIFMLNAG